MKGIDGKRLLIRMYDPRRAAQHALHSLKDAGFSETAIEVRIWDHAMDLYRGRGTTVLETFLAGAVVVRMIVDTLRASKA